MHLIVRYIVGTIAGYLYLEVFMYLFGPVELRIKGKRFHHDSCGTIVGLLIIIPLVFFFYILNFDLLNWETFIKLGTSLIGLATGTVIEHKILHKRERSNK